MELVEGETLADRLRNGPMSCVRDEEAGTRYMLDRPLSEMAAELEPSAFWQFGKGKLLLEVPPAAEKEIIVSQERAAAFREWLRE